MANSNRLYHSIVGGRQAVVFALWWQTISKLAGGGKQDRNTTRFVHPLPLPTSKIRADWNRIMRKHQR